MIIRIIILCISILISIYGLSTYKDFHVKLYIKPKPLKEFSYPIKLQGVGKDIEIEQQYPCTINELRKCNINDQTSCFGCKSLIAECIHFDEDKTFIDSNGKKTIIKKNDTPEEGYCLSLKTFAEKCNPYHGDLVIVELDKEHLGLVCSCRNPGFIGNTNLYGDCSHVFVCNGHINDINQPITQIKCKCNDDQQSIISNGVPICKEYTVSEYPKQADIPYEYMTLNIEYFNSTIRGNLPGQKVLRNPCSNCILTERFCGHAYTDSQGTTTQCRSNFYGYGIPIRRSKNGRILRGEQGPDGMLGIYYNHVVIFGYQKPGDFICGYVAFNNHDRLNNPIFDALKLDYEKTYAIELYENELTFPGNFAPNLTFEYVPRLYCSIRWPYYDCYIGIGKGNNRQTYSLQNIELKAFNPYPVPGSYLWGGQVWSTVENYNPTVKLILVNNLVQIVMSKVVTYRPANVKFMYVRNNVIYFVYAKDEDDWREFQNTLIKT